MDWIPSPPKTPSSTGSERKISCATGTRMSTRSFNEHAQRGVTSDQLVSIGHWRHTTSEIQQLRHRCETSVDDLQCELHQSCRTRGQNTSEVRRRQIRNGQAEIRMIQGIEGFCA